jgi:putative membrane protein
MFKTALKAAVCIIASAGFIAYAQTDSSATSATAVPGLTDGQIVAIVKQANESEVDLGKVGKSKADNKEVKEFSKHMIDAHNQGEKDTKEAAKKSKVKAVESADSRMIKDNTKTKISDLKKLKGKDFDRAYIDTQIAMHQTLLNDLNQKFIPSAQSTDVKSLLQNTKSQVEEHLANAQKIQSALMQ